MKGEFKNIFKVASVYMAAVIGAGFASGREIVQFFSRYYQGGVYGIIFAGLMFSIIGYIVLDKVFRERIKSYEEFLFPAVGWHIGWLMELAVSLFMLSVFTIMIAGSGKILESMLSIPFKYGIFIMAVVCTLILLFGIRGVTTLSTLVTPILIIGILFIGFYIIIIRDVSVFNAMGYITRATDNWLFSSLLYVSYNSISSVVVMCSLLPYLKTRKVGAVGGILGGAMLCFMALILNLAIALFYPDSLMQEIPVLDIIRQANRLISYLYSIILWLAMLLSASINSYGFMERVTSKLRVNRRLAAVVLCALVIPLSSLGFSNLIAFLYPVFGYIGLFMVFVILLMGVKDTLIPFFSRKSK